MLRAKDPSFLEQIPHMTRSEPYSLSRTAFSGAQETALTMHWHPEAELFFLEEGAIDLWVEEEKTSLLPGDAVFVPPGLLHRATAKDGCPGAFRALVFSTDLVYPPSDGGNYRKYVQPALSGGEGNRLHMKRSDPAHREALRDLARIFSAGGEDGEELLVTGLVRAIWRDIFRLHLANRTPLRLPGQMEALMQQVVELISARYPEDLTLGMLAREVHVSDAQLCRSFRQLTGMTPFTYIKRYRVLKSCEWLLNTDRKIGEIATACGFNNISYYNREFQKIMKTTPSAYRKTRNP